VGYTVQRHPVVVRFPLVKGAMPQDATRQVARRHLVATSIARSLLGIWIWGALLKREHLSIPHAIFRFIDQNQDATVLWWPSVRAGFFAMASVIPALSADVGARLAPVVFASDAQGVGEGDVGGWGIVASDVDQDTARRCLHVGMRPGLTVVKLSGGSNGSKRPDLQLRRSVPFTR
jgi:hypothetical protein